MREYRAGIRMEAVTDGDACYIRPFIAFADEKTAA